MRAAGIVADHAANGAVRVRRRIRAEYQSLRARLGLQRVEHGARLDASEPAFFIELDHPIHVLRHIDDDGHIAALAGEAGSTAAREHRGAVLAAQTQRFHHLVGIARQHHADGHLAIVGCVGRVQRAAALVEPDLAAQASPKIVGERSHVRCDSDHFSYAVAENRQRATPASVDSIPTSANQEDHVAMATHGARRLLDMAESKINDPALDRLIKAKLKELSASPVAPQSEAVTN